MNFFGSTLYFESLHFRVAYYTVLDNWNRHFGIAVWHGEFEFLETQSGDSMEDGLKKAEVEVTKTCSEAFTGGYVDGEAGI